MLTHYSLMIACYLMLLKVYAGMDVGQFTYVYLKSLFCLIVSHFAHLKNSCSLIEPYLFSFYLNIHNNLMCSSSFYLHFTLIFILP